MARVEFKFPDVGEGLDKGVILAWRVEPGEEVTADQILVELETDKAIVEIPAPVSGRVVELGAKVGETLAVGAVLAVIESAGDKAPVGPGATDPDPAGTTRQPLATREGGAEPTPHRVKASPATRKLARALGVDLGQIAGTGSRGQVTRDDVDRAHRSPASAATPSADLSESGRAAESSIPSSTVVRPLGEDRVEPLAGLRRQIARNMDVAWRTVPHIFSLEEIEATELVRALAALRSELAPLRLSYLPFFVKASVAALEEHPRFNASLDLDAERIIYHHRYNIGIATATPDGLIVTVVHDANEKSLGAIAREIEALASLARARRVSLSQIRGATFTISNYGSYGAWMGTPIIRPPEVAIAGFGRIHDAVVPVDGEPAVRKMLPLVISADHRLNDGEHLGGFLRTMTAYLQEPVRLLGRS